MTKRGFSLVYGISSDYSGGLGFFSHWGLSEQEIILFVDGFGCPLCRVFSPDVYFLQWRFLMVDVVLWAPDNYSFWIFWKLRKVVPSVGDLAAYLLCVLFLVLS